MIGFEIINAQVQDISLNVIIKNRLSISNKPLSIPQRQTQNEDPTHLFKRLAVKGICIRRKHSISINQKSKIFSNYHPSVIPY